MQKDVCRYLRSYSPGGSRRHEVGPDGCNLGPILREEEAVGAAMVLFERAMVVSYRVSTVNIALPVTIRPQFVMECRRRSNQQGWVTFAQNGKEGVDRCKLNFNTNLERHGVVAWNRNLVDIFCCLSTMHERGRQTNRPRIGNIDRDRRNHFSAMSSKTD